MQSPAGSVSSISSTVNTGSSKKSGVAISLNGLFGESYGFEDVISTSFSTPSPLCRNFTGSKVNSISPSKSLSVELNYNQQPVLLSDLADGSSFNTGGTGVLLHGHALCSFVSSYDNSRCTNSAVVKADGSKSFCHKHQKLVPKDIASQNTTPKMTATKLLSTANSKKPLSLKHNSSAAQLLYSCCNSSSRSTPVDQASVLVRSSTSNGVNVNGGQALLSFPQSAASNIVFPVSYINAGNHQTNNAKKINFDSSRNIFRAVPLVSTKTNQQKKSTTVQVKPGKLNAGGNNTVLPMDRDVLQAFVDFLNQNPDRLTPKQQLSLLKSLGVTVATVKNPEDFNNISLQTANTCHPSSSVVQNHISTSNWNKNTSVSSGSLPNPSNVTNALKRKVSVCKDFSGTSKKVKLTPSNSYGNSLQHLSSAELDERVLESIASVGCISKRKSPAKESAKKSKAKEPRQNSIWKNHASQPVSPPCISLPINQNKNEHLLKEKFSNSSVKSYVECEINKELMSQNLFSLGPFHEIPNRSSSANQEVIEISSKTKQKPVKQTLTKPLSFSKCGHIDTKNCSIHLYDTLLQTSAKMLTDLCKFKSNRTSDSNAFIDELMSNDGNTETSTSSASLDAGKAITLKRYRLLNKGAKLWKKLEKEEIESIRHLAKAVQSNVTECVKVVKSLGHRSTTRLRKRQKCGSAPSMCALTHRNGHRCSNSSLPLSFYCLDHIMHSNHQHLYKFGTNMNVVADIYPDPPLVKQRKKTKLPPLSKRKKRRVKRRNTLKEANTSQLEGGVGSKPEVSKNEVAGQTKLRNLFQLCHSQQIMSDYAVDNIDDIMTSSNTVQMRSLIDDPTLSMKTNLLNDNLPCNAEEDSNSAMFEAFSFEEELLHDVAPDVFSDLGLDNAFLLTGAGDTIDKLSFDDLDDEESLFSNKTIEEDIQTQASKNSATDEATQSSQSSVQSSVIATDSVLSSERQLVSCQKSNSQPETQQAAWPPKHEGTSSSNGFGDASPSLDSSFAEDLNELEGVIQSLQDETFKFTTSVADSRSNWSVDDYKNSLKNEASINIQENKATAEGNYLEIAATLPSTSCSSEVTYSSNLPTSKNVTCNQTFVNGNCSSFEKNEQTTSSSNQVTTVLSNSNEINTADVMENNRVIKSTRKPKSKTSPRKRSDLAPTRSVSQAALVLSPSRNLIFSSAALASSQNNTSTNPTSIINTMQTQNLNEHAKSGRKMKFGATSNLSNVTSQGTTRMQPRLMSANVVTGTGKASSQNVVLIPINAVVRSANQVGLQSGNQNLGLAFAIPAPNMGGNVSTMIPIRGSAFLTSSNQQVLILGTAPTNNVPANMNQTVYQTTTVASKSMSNPALTKSVPLSIYNVNQTAKPPLVSAVNINSASSANVTVTAFPSSNVSTTSLPKPSNSTNNQPFKKQFNRDSIVIPPALNDVYSNKLNKSLNSVPSSTASAKSVRSKATVDTTSSTVHWGKTVKPVPQPPPQRKLSDGVGGQTSNMLYCRRINPSLNNNQHVIVGRLGSLARIGHPRRASKHDSKLTKKANVQSQDSPLETFSSLHGVKTTTVGCTQGTDFISLSPSSNKTTVEVCRTNALWNGYTQSDPAVSKSSIGEVSSSQLRDLSNQPQAINSDPLRESRHSLDPSSTADIIRTTAQSTSDIAPRHGSRKSDHSQMLKDPDFCESPAAVVTSTKDLVLTESNFSIQTSSQNFNSVKINEAVPEVGIKEGGNALFGGKASRRAAILRKR